MRNQTSFRLTSTVLPTDLWWTYPAKVTTVINKLDEWGNKFYPKFTEETVVLTNDDRTVMETVRARADWNWNLTFVKRGLSDDVSAESWDNRKLTWNPWTLCFITAWASDWIDKDDDITWTGKQTYTGEMVSMSKATYKWELITEKWVKYPHFDTVADLEAYTAPFGWMFAVVDSTWELYRYNAVTEEWSLIESSTPANPEMADDETIGTVRIATDTEFEAWTDTGSHWEYLAVTPAQVQWATPDTDLKLFTLDSTSDLTTAQAIFDYYKSWKAPVIKRHLQEWLRNQYFFYFPYLDTVTNNYLRFITIQVLRVDASWEWTVRFQKKIDLNYNWNTVTSVDFIDEYS